MGYGVLMHLLSLRKISLETKKLRLEVDSIRTNNEKLSLEIEKLKKEKDRDEKADRINVLAKRILNYVKKESTDALGERKALGLSAQELSETLNENLEEVEGALSVLKGQGAAKYNSQFYKWIFS